MPGLASQFALWSLPLFGAFNGWITTHLAIRMLFRPRQPLRVFGLSYQAPLPKRQHEIAHRIGSIIEGEILNYADIRERVVTPEFIARVESAINEQVGEMLDARRAKFPSVVQKLITDDLLNLAQRKLTKELIRRLPEMIDQIFGLLSANVSIKTLIAEKVADFELSRLEEVVFSLAARELRMIELLCGLLGLMIGFAQLALGLMQS